MFFRVFFLLIVTLSLFLTSCFSSNKGADKPTSSGVATDKKPNELTAKGGMLKFNKDEYVTKELDINKDKIPDILNVYKKGKNEEGKDELKLHVKQMDLNHDNKIDIWRFYDDKGNVIKEEIDLDFDQHIDVSDYYHRYSQFTF